MINNKYLITAMVGLGLGLGGCAASSDIHQVDAIRTNRATGGTALYARFE